jgi:pimeloyl-ACP methyl ester carboxylesterase
MPIVLSNYLITPNKHKIAYTYFNAGHKNVVIIAHGFYNSKDAIILQNLAKSLLDDYDVFMFDFSGHGKSSGLYTWTSHEDKDLKTALDFLKNKYTKKGLIAFSLGGSVSINILSKYQLTDSLICISVPSEFNKIDYQFWKLDWKGDLIYTLFTREGRIGRGFRPGPFWLKKEKPLDNVGKIKIPILYIHGEKDWVVKPWHSKVLYEKTNSRKKLVYIKNGTHAEYLIRDNPKELIGLIKEWFSETL